MKTLNHHVIIYDNECPMCDLYTRAFVNSGMLGQQGREPFNGMPDNLKQRIDLPRACNEIALVDVKTGNTTYGIDSLFKIIGNSMPLFKPLFSSSTFRWVMKKVYGLISYNRKVIIPGKKFEAEDSCTPALNLKYRWMYIILTWLFTSLVLNEYANLLTPFLLSGNLLREFIICGGQIVFQAAVVSMLNKRRVVHYLGNMMTISFAGGLLLLPAIVLAELQWVSSIYFFPVWFSVVVALMFFEHVRRVKILELHWSASLSWVVYRIMVLVVIVNPLHKFL